MTIDQSIGSKPVTPVVPLHSRGDTPPAGRFAQDFFDLVSDTMTACGADEDTTRTCAALIAAGHDARMQALDNKRVQAERAAFAYGTMDRAHHDILIQVKRMTGQLVETNARVGADREALAKVRHDIRELIRAANERGSEVIGVPELEAAVRLDTPPVPHRPVILGLAIDHRFSHGVFELADRPGVTTTRTFLGWSLVYEQPVTHTVPEATFIDEDGITKTVSQLHHEGLLYMRLT